MESTMNQAVQSLPPGWRIEASAPSANRKDCVIRITSPSGLDIVFHHSPDRMACDLMKQLGDAMSGNGQIESD